MPALSPEVKNLIDRPNFAHLATLVKRIRASRPGALLLDGGDTWQGSAVSLWTQGRDMIQASQLLGVDLMTAHWEFTYGAERVQQVVEKDFAGRVDFVAQNVKTLRGARTVGLDPATHALYLPATKGPPSDDFVVLVVGRYGTPFVVADRVGIGGVVFLAGRSLVVLLHESAHALTMTSFGRRPGRAGAKVVLVFPYAFVDTSDMWF